MIAYKISSSFILFFIIINFSACIMDMDNDGKPDYCYDHQLRITRVKPYLNTVLNLGETISIECEYIIDRFNIDMYYLALMKKNENGRFSKVAEIDLFESNGFVTFDYLIDDITVIPHEFYVELNKRTGYTILQGCEVYTGIIKYY